MDDTTPDIAAIVKSWKPRRKGGKRIKISEIKTLLVALRPSLAPTLEKLRTLKEVSIAVGVATEAPALSADKAYDVFLSYIPPRDADNPSRIDVNWKNFIASIKAVRDTCNLGLHEAKEACDKVRNGVPMLLAYCVTAEHADMLTKRFAVAGCGLRLEESSK